MMCVPTVCQVFLRNQRINYGTSIYLAISFLFLDATSVCVGVTQFQNLKFVLPGRFTGTKVRGHVGYYSGGACGARAHR